MTNFTKYLSNLPVISFLFVVYVQTSLAVIYQLNDTEYKKLPPVFHVDPFEECMQDPAGVYCIVEAALVSDDHTPLMEIITEYSAHTVSHYNHSLLRYNLCITNTCKKFYDNTTTGLVQDLEACLNKTLEEKYGLKTKLLANNVHCKKANEEIKTEVADFFMVALLIGILIANIVGSLYDFICTNGNKGEGILLLTSFSIRRNWRKLVARPLEGPDSRLERLKFISCIKFISTALVVLGHTTVSSLFYIHNTKFIEDLYKNVGAQFLWSGTIVVQTFFLISGFLLSYNLELMSERTSFKVNWLLVPKGIVLRWIRLTPPYAFVLFFTVTIKKYIITGPHWHYAGVVEIEDCQRYWWHHLLYFNNYNESQCMLHTWYLASDSQLYILGLVIYVVCRGASSRKVVLPLLMVVATLISLGHTYWQDLDGILVASPELILRQFLNDRTFTYLYIRGHTNMFSYLAGLSVGFLAYHGQQVNFDAQKYRKYSVLFYSIIPLGAALVLSGCVFFRDGPRPSLAVRMLFAAYQKPVWCLFLGTGMLAVIFKFERVFRGVVEWRAWTVLARLSYCAYLLHVLVIRLFMSINDMTNVTYVSMVEHAMFILTMAYVGALPMWLLLEEPATRLLAALLHGSRQRPGAATQDTIIKEEEKNNRRDEQLTRV